MSANVDHTPSMLPRCWLRCSMLWDAFAKTYVLHAGNMNHSASVVRVFTSSFVYRTDSIRAAVWQRYPRMINSMGKHAFLSRAGEQTTQHLSTPIPNRLASYPTTTTTTTTTNVRSKAAIKAIGNVRKDAAARGALCLLSKSRRRRCCRLRRRV